MSTITQKVCDRCGKPMKYSGWTAKIENFLKPRKTIKVVKLFCGNQDGYSYSERNFELCADCTQELEKFFKG